jgi:hypothetical protein
MGARKVIIRRKECLGEIISVGQMVGSYSARNRVLFAKLHDYITVSNFGWFELAIFRAF